ncbi:MAG TPA: cytochrome c peroxidase [Sphingobacteriaceae bacterium]
MIKVLSALILITASLLLVSFNQQPLEAGSYSNHYRDKIDLFENELDDLLSRIRKMNANDPAELSAVKKQLDQTRIGMKATDFWFRYLEPIVYKKINGPLPVEWETEVFEKFENPYKREGAGLTLAGLYLEEPGFQKDSLLNLVQSARDATEVYRADSITRSLETYHHFFLCNRLYLLNLAAIYTTGFECPDKTNIITELNAMLISVNEIYRSYNESFPQYPVSESYLDLYARAMEYTRMQPEEADQFDHFRFIQQYINPLFALNQEMIRRYRVVTSSYNDFSLKNSSTSLFDKSLFEGQDPKGVYYGIRDESILNEIKETGRMLFHDPLLSANNKRSCASCHKPAQYFADTVGSTSLQFNEKEFLPRNTPSLINVVYNHLVNHDGRHFNLQNQAKDVLTNPQEMASREEDILKKVLSCEPYRTSLKKYAALTPYTKKLSLEHLTSAITLYYSDFSKFYSPFDEAMNENKAIHEEVKLGFNLFMGKAECGTCHFVPHFNGVKPPYIGSEFEVLGVPADKQFKMISKDEGRHGNHAAPETKNAFRTGTIRNTPFTKPYMHNGVFSTLEEVIDFYDQGGGAGRGLHVSNQTLSSDSLKLTEHEKKALITFIHSLNERVSIPPPPGSLPRSSIKSWNNRKIGGEY